jgi:hypothetical protein
MRRNFRTPCTVPRPIRSSFRTAHMALRHSPIPPGHRCLIACGLALNRCAAKPRDSGVADRVRSGVGLARSWRDLLSVSAVPGTHGDAFWCCAGAGVVQSVGSLAGGVDAAWHVPAADPVGELDGHDVVAGGGDGAADVQLAERAARSSVPDCLRPGRPSAAAASPLSGPHRRHRELHRRLERPLPPLHPDQDRRRDTPQMPPR